ncbi:hypothetical protein JZO76_00255 [Enterococcus sp. MJM12]|uniref:Uncharacterized protein n=1 Tax=Candidatus Enterococcus myersii TaxID=2815322 RepID=A0ABS3H4V2_9ENTE|nr:hypothetical protein [Enterococcus sp. MJM12]MBO0447960.1 hypothetical protein [Enterococcus sp. MJM12]
MSDLKKRLRHDWQFILIALTTAGIGINFLIHPGLLEDKSTYAFIMNVLDDAVFSVPIMVAGIIGVILFLFGKKQYRSFLLVFYQFVWMILLLAYAWRAISGFQNSSWIMALCINVAIFLLALWGDTDG